MAGKSRASYEALGEASEVTFDQGRQKVMTDGKLVKQNKAEQPAIPATRPSSCDDQRRKRENGTNGM
jgi:hypothetical protein